MLIRISLITLLLTIYSSSHSQCFISTPIQVCQGSCGPVFWLLNDPQGTTYSWSVTCGTITNPNVANPHTVCFNTPGLCEIHAIVSRPGEAPDTCIAYVLVEPTSTEHIVEIICQGDSVEVNGTYYTPGVYMDTIFGANIHSCDSFLVILVAEIPYMYDTIAMMFCTGSGDSIVVNGTTYNETNPSGTEYIIGAMGCIETVVTINLSYLPPIFSSVTYTGCAGDGYSIIVGGNIYNESNPSGSEILTGSNGCDSIVTINLIYYPLTYNYIIYSGCTGDGYSVTVDSIVYDESNPTGMDTLTGVNGCDSINIIDLVFMPPSHDTISYEGCMGDGYSVTVLDSVFNENNPTGTIIFQSSNCDSIVFIDLHFADCPDSLIINGHEICVSGMGSQYSWYTCYGIPLPDTTQCIHVADTGCVCVSFTDGSGFDTLCLTYNLCDLACDIITPEQICAGDSVLITFASNDTSLAFIQWTVMLDSFATQTFTGTDSLWLVYYVPGCYSIQLQLQDSGCVTFCTDTICVFNTPSAFICCDVVDCDSCASLQVFLTGTPPFTVAISNGTTTDTISGITSSPYSYLVCPPYDTSYAYTLLWMIDSSAACSGIINTATASVYLEQRPNANITIQGDTLCAQPSGLAYNWVDCQNTVNLSFDQCYVPTASGCYCVTVSTLLTDCLDFTCIDFILDATHHPVVPGKINVWYDQGSNSIFIRDSSPLTDNTEIQLIDILGRTIPYVKKEYLYDGTIQVFVEENVPSILFISLSTQQFRYTQGVFTSK